MTQDDRTMVSDLSQRLERLENLEAIRDGLYRCARGIDRRDLALLKACYHPEAIEVHWIYVGEAAGFAEFIIAELADFRTVRHMLGNSLIDLQGARAFVETHYWGTAVLDLPEEGEGSFAEHHSYGRYLDLWEKRHGEWRIAHRHLTDDGGSTRLVRGQSSAPFDRRRSAQNAPDDPVYLGFAIREASPPPMQVPSALARSVADRARAT